MASLRDMRGLGPRRGHAYWYIFWGTPQQEKLIGRDVAEQRAQEHALRLGTHILVTDQQGYAKFIVSPMKDQPWVLVDPREDAAWHNGTN